MTEKKAQCKPGFTLEQQVSIFFRHVFFIVPLLWTHFICCGIIAGERLLLAQGQGFDHPFAMGSNFVWFTFDGGKDTFNGKNKEELFGQNYGDMEAKRDNLYNI